MALLDESLEYRFENNANDVYDYLCALMVNELSEEYEGHSDEEFYDLVKAKYYNIRIEMEKYLKEFSPWLVMDLPDPVFDGKLIDFPRPEFRRI